MKIVSARATFSKKARNLFSTRESARETVKGILEVRDSKEGAFVVRGSRLRTERSIAPAKKK